MPEFPAGEDQINETLLASLKEDLVRQTIKSLEEMCGDCLLSGEDSGLKNVWEEVCVQVQDEERATTKGLSPIPRALISMQCLMRFLQR